MSLYDGMLLRGASLMTWAIRWFSMSNDAFFELYGFNFNPHDYPGLYEAARARVYPQEVQPNVVDRFYQEVGNNVYRNLRGEGRLGRGS